MNSFTCRFLIGLIALVTFDNPVSAQETSSKADTSTQKERRPYGLFGTGMLPDSVYFRNPPKIPFSASDYVFTLDQIGHRHISQGEFLWGLAGESYGFDVSFIIGETHPGGGPPLHVHELEEDFVLLEGSARFVLGDSTLTVQGPCIVKGPALVPHTFLNVGSEPFNMVAVIPSKRTGGSKRLGPNPLRPPVDESTLPPDESVSLRAPRATITVDGSATDWAGLESDVLAITCGAGKLAAEVRYAWNPDHLYVLIRETPGDTTRKEAEDAKNYLDTPFGYDGISFFLDVDNRALHVEGDNADFNPWFGFSSTGRSDLYCARSNKYWPQLAGLAAYRTYANGNQEMLHNSMVATSGHQSDNSRVIEVAIRWSDIEAGVDAKRLRGGFPVIRPELRIGCEPLLLDDGAANQRFLNGDRTMRPNGRDVHSRDIVLTE